MRFVFPSDVIDPKKPDEAFSDQIQAFRAAGFPVSFVSIESLQTGGQRMHPPLQAGETIVYRGWMMNEREHRLFCDAISSAGATPLSDTTTYLECHHLPNWYPRIREFTPRTIIFPADTDLTAELDALDWDGYFIKDYVKSLKTDSGSLLRSTEHVGQLVSDMIRFRGEIEGGFCVREVEEFVADSEIRYFVILGTPFSSEEALPIPDIVIEAARRIPSRFFTIDAIRRSDGEDRIVEIGDGQVSDIVGWSAQRLAEIWKTLLEPSHRDGSIPANRGDVCE